MASWTLRPSGLQLHLNPEGSLEHYVPETNQTLPSEDYYLYERGDGNEDQSDDEFGLDSEFPILRNIVEDANRIYIERNVFALLNTSLNIPIKETEASMDVSVTNTSEHVATTHPNPPSFILFGKPGVGKSTLANVLTQKLNSVLISPNSIVDYYQKNGLPPDLSVEELIHFQDGTISMDSPKNAIKTLLRRRINEKDVLIRGFVLDGFPILGSEELTVENQINFLHTLPRKPDFVISIHMQNVDLYNRRRLQKYDPLTNTVYTLEQYMAAEVQSPNAALNDFALLSRESNYFGDSDSEDEDEEGHTHHTRRSTAGGRKGRSTASESSSIATTDDPNESEEDKEEYETDDTSIVEMEFKPLEAVILGRLVSRQEDRPMAIRQDISNYKAALQYMQSYVDTFDNRKVLELSAYFLPSVLARMLDEFLDNFGVVRVPTPVEKGEEIHHIPPDHEVRGEDDSSSEYKVHQSEEETTQVFENKDEEVEGETEWNETETVEDTCLRNPRFPNIEPKNLCSDTVGRGTKDQTGSIGRSVIPNAPFYIFVFGYPKSGKTELSRRLASNLGLAYISCDTIVKDIIKHANMSQVTQGDAVPYAEGSPMKLADEVLAYLRKGKVIPQYIMYKILDVALMEPNAQYHGVVFDDYPLEDFQLQEMLERGIIPSVVVNLQMDNSEAYRRVIKYDSAYNYEVPLPPPDALIDYEIEDYENQTKHPISWYDEEIQCLLNVDATQSPTVIFNQVKDKCYLVWSQIQNYIYCATRGLPCQIQGLSTLKSLIPGKLSKTFGTHDTVALNDFEELIEVKDFKNLACIVEYLGELYAFSIEENALKFISNYKSYTLPDAKRVPPAEFPTIFSFTEPEMIGLKKLWGFKNLDPVLYVEKGSRNIGNPSFAIQYKSRYYFFTNAETQDKFMKKPHAYTNIKLPKSTTAAVPGAGKRTNTKLTLDSDSLSPAGYLIASGLSNIVCRMLELIVRTRPKFPFMSTTKSVILYLGYYLKTLNMKSSLELRTHYRKAMEHITKTQKAAHEIIQEMKKYDGEDFISNELKERIDLLLQLAELPDTEKVVDPLIRDLKFNYDYVHPCYQAPDANIILADPVIEKLQEEEMEGELGESGDYGDKSKVAKRKLNIKPPPYLSKNRFY